MKSLLIELKIDNLCRIPNAVSALNGEADIKNLIRKVLLLVYHIAKEG